MFLFNSIHAATACLLSVTGMVRLETYW